LVYLQTTGYHHVQSDFKRHRRVFWSIHEQNDVRVGFCQAKANRRGSFNNIFISGGRPANFVKLCPHFNNMVNSRGENDYFPKIVGNKFEKIVGNEFELSKKKK
jgi:hypothetical protein